MNPYSGLFSEPLSITAETEFKKLMITEELLTLMDQASVSRTELAKRMEVAPSRVTGMLRGSNNFTIETLVRAGRALGAELHLHFVPLGHQACFSMCKADEVHDAFRFSVKPKQSNNLEFKLTSSALNDDARAA